MKLARLLLVLCAGCAGSGQGADAPPSPDLAARIDAGTIAVIADGDFVAQTYATGRLAPVEAGHRDVLTILSRADGALTTSAIEVSNSVTAAPEVLALARDGSAAFVTERLGPRPPGAQTIPELPPGRRLFAIDLSSKGAPRLADTAEIGPSPEALDVSPDGSRVAVVANTPEASLVQIVPYASGGFGQVASFRLGDLGIVGTGSGPRGGVTATNVQWHPSGRFLAVNLDTWNRVAFLEVTEGANGAIALRRWGNLVEVGPDPFVGRFTPDGRHYLTADWGRNFAATTVEDRLPTAPSAISVIRLADPQASADAAEHRRVGGAETDLSSEGLAVSPDGRLVATVNMRGTAFLPGSPRFTREATVTLLAFDPGSGALTRIASYPFEGVLPEGGSFDLSGDHFLATVFQYHEGGPPGGGVEVFRVVHGERPALERLGRLPLPHGVHHVDVAP
ncbi:hypothetical protein ACMHYB_09650 [Sorangium sp. So ce1128]